MENNRTFRLAFVAAGTALFVYVALKAGLMAITWDEAFSYRTFIVPNRMYPGAGGGMAANNHLLNTWLTAVSVSLFGGDEWAMRLPNVLAFAVYLYVTGRFAWSLRSRVTGVSAFLLLNTNPYLVDFFCLSRGYGLSFALLAGSLYKVLRFTDARRHADFNGAVWLGMAATLANLSLLPYVLVVFLLPWFVRLVENPPYTWERARDSAQAVWAANGARLNIALLVFLACLVPYGLVLQHYGAFYYGGSTGFWHDTVRSVIDRSLYGRYGHGWVRFIGTGALLLAGGAALLAFRRHRRQAVAVTRYVPFLFILAGCAAVQWVQHWLLGTLYLIERSALYLYILFVAFAALAAEASALRFRPAPWVLACMAVAMALHFTRVAGIQYVLEWKRDADVRDMLADLRLLKENRGAGNDKPLRVGVSLEFEQPVNFYLDRDTAAWMEPVDRLDGNKPGMDYYLLDRYDLASFPFRYKRIRTYDISGGTLLESTP